MPDPFQQAIIDNYVAEQKAAKQGAALNVKPKTLWGKLKAWGAEEVDVMGGVKEYVNALEKNGPVGEFMVGAGTIVGGAALMSGLTVGVLAVNAVVAPIAGVLTLVDLVTDPKGATERIDASMTDRQKNC